MPEQPNIPDYFVHPVEGVRRFVARPRRALQVAEVNGIQDMIMDRLERVGDAQFGNGDIISGIIPRRLQNDPNGNLSISDGTIYLKGDIRTLIPVILTIPLLTRVAVGIRYNTITVTENDNASLKDPALGTPNFGEAGMARIEEQITWGYHDDTGAADANPTWQFFPIFEVDKGVILLKTSSGVDLSTRELIASYDRNAHGNYVVSGLICSYASKDSQHYYLNVGSGIANIYGYQIQRGTDSRFSLPFDYNTEIANFEPHTFQPDGNNRCKLILNRTPLAVVTQIVAMKQKTVSVTRGISANTSDEMPDNSIAEIVSVMQGQTPFFVNTSYIVNGDNINWGPNGAEPAPGSTYQVTYRYLTQISAHSTANTYVEVADLVPGSIVQLSYTRKLPRVDLIVIDTANTLLRIKGVARTNNPAPPRSSSNQIALATVTYDWVNNPIVRQIATTHVPYDQIQSMRASLEDLFTLVANLNMKVNLANTDPSTKRGMFTDPFIDDDLRDQGIVQTGSIVQNSLQLPIAATIIQPLQNTENNKYLPYTHTPILAQLSYSECMLINPYDNFEPQPAKLALIPPVDRWVDIHQTWTSPITLVFVFRGRGGGVSVWTEILSRTRAQIPFIRRINVDFAIEAFLPTEQLTLLTFDGVNVTPP